MKNYNNILFINFGGIGDEILFLPVISSVKKKYRDSKITLALEDRSKSIKDLTLLIDQTISINIKEKGIKKVLNLLKFIFKARKQKFDCVISSGKSPYIAIILFLTGIKERIGFESKFDFLLTKKALLNENQYAAKMYYGLAQTISDVEFENPKIDIVQKFNLNPDFKKNEYICIHPGVSKMSVIKNILKCPEKNFWINLIEGILNKGKQVVLLGSNDDKDIIFQILQNEKIKNNPNFINYFNKTKNILEMAFIMKNSASVICVDSAPMHVAAGVGAKTYAIFAPTNENKLVPKESNVEVIAANIPCRPCLWDKRSTNCKTSDCLNIDYNMILDKIY